MFGDPHFITFDGNPKPVIMNTPSMNSFWAVKSSNVRIQGYATGNGNWIQGVAVSGPFMNGHKLLAWRDTSSGINVLWDGAPQLRSQGSKFTVPGMAGVELQRNSGSDFIPSEEELKKIFGKAADSKNWFQLDQALRRWREKRDVYKLKLPDRVEVWLISSTLPGAGAAEIIIKMPPQDRQGGWCGNFNGKKEDDESAGDLTAVPENEDLFKERNIKMAEAGPVSTVTNTCGGEALAMSKHACAHLLEAGVREACIVDVCTTKQLELATNAADDVAIMKGLLGAGEKKCTSAPKTASAPEALSAPKAASAPEKVTAPKVASVPENATAPKVASAPAPAKGWSWPWSSR